MNVQSDCSFNVKLRRFLGLTEVKFIAKVDQYNCYTTLIFPQTKYFWTEADMRYVRCEVCVGAMITHAGF